MRAPITLHLPLRTVSLANEHGHWRKRHARSKAERAAVRYAWIAENLRPLRDESATVHLTRVAPRSLDSDNLPPSCKSIRDEIAACLGLDDRSPRVVWTYAQEKGPYSVRVEITFDGAR
jgi:hypothetical protein